MSSDKNTKFGDRIIQSPADLMEFFGGNDKLLVGGELEAMVLHDLTPVPNSGRHGSQVIFRDLQNKFNASARRLGDNRIYQLDINGHGNVVFEPPASDIELSTIPVDSADNLDQISCDYIQSLAQICGRHGNRFCPFDVQPFTTRPDGDDYMGPNPRYQTGGGYNPIGEFFAGNKHAAEHSSAMLSTHISTGYKDPDHLFDMMRTVYAITPGLSALGATSPAIYPGQIHGQDNLKIPRMTLFQEMDQDRSGAPLSLLEKLYAPEAGMEDVINWMLDRRVLTIKRDNEFVDVGKKTFRDLINDPDPRIGDVTFDDFQSHISSTWIIARPDHYRLESRMIGVGTWKAGAFGALLRGILHTEPGIKQSLEMIETLDFTPAQLHDAINQCGEYGLKTKLADQTYREIMSEIVEIASDNLSLPEQGLLSPLKDMLESGMTDSDVLKDMYDEASSDRDYRENLGKIMGDINYISRTAPERVTNLHAMNYDTCVL